MLRIETLFWVLVFVVAVATGCVVAICSSAYNKRAVGIWFMASADAQEEMTLQRGRIERARRIAEDDARVAQGLRPVHFTVHSRPEAMDEREITERKKR